MRRGLTFEHFENIEKPLESQSGCLDESGPLVAYMGILSRLMNTLPPDAVSLTPRGVPPVFSAGRHMQGSTQVDQPGHRNEFSSSLVYHDVRPKQR